MSLSFNQSTDLSDKTFSFTFEYIALDDVHVIGQRISDDVWVQLTVTGRDPAAKTVTVSDDLTPYDKVQVYRQTTVAPLVDFQNGALLTEKDLDNAYRQGLFVAQEVAENANQSTQREDVDTDIIADSAITSSKIANGNVTDQKLATTLNLSTHSVTLATGEIDTNELADDAVNSTKLADDAVNSTKLADDAVDSEHIVDGSVDNVHLSGNIDLATKVTGELPVANGGTGVTTAIPFTKGFTTTIAIPAVDTTTTAAAHNLGATPKLITFHLVCTAAINGYAVNDIVTLAGDHASGIPCNAFADDTNIYFRRDSVLTIVRRDAAGHFDLTSSNFDLVLSAYC